jgi:glycosyltransferase involved in cell wall biosynthesis
MVIRSGITYHLHPYLSPLKPRTKLIKESIKVSNFFRSLKPDIIFSYHYSSDFSEALSAKLAGAKFVYIKKNMGWKGPSHNQWLIKTWLSAAITVQNSDMMTEFFPNNAKAELVSLGVDTNEYYPRAKNFNLLKELNISADKKIILCVANIIPKKGIDFLLKGFKQSKSCEKAHLVIVGDDTSELGQHLHQLKSELGLDSQVTFTGKRFDVPDFYTIADLFILPSTGNEGAPVAIQEAMASGVVVVTTDTPGNRDQLRELPRQLIPPSDEIAIAKALDEFLHISEAEKNSIIQTQLQIVEERYSLEQEVKKHEALYLKLMGRKV